MDTKVELLTRIHNLIAKSDATLSTKQSSGFSASVVDAILFASFRSSGLSFLKSLYGLNHPYYNDFNDRCQKPYFHETENGKGILLAVQEEIENGWINTLKGLVTAEIFSNFIEMAEHLLEQKYKDASAVIIGSTLEEHLKNLCNDNAIHTIEKKANGKEVRLTADQLNIELAKNGVYNKIAQKEITSYLGIRNSAAHGHYSHYDQQQVAQMLYGVTTFISKTT
jgi:hypothetical protein